MDVYVARQPIFDAEMNLYGYELLYRKGPNNFYEGNDENVATASVLANSFLVFGFDELVGGSKGFINFPQELLQQEIPLILPKQRVVIEILENVKATSYLLDACLRLKSKGYLFALDDYAVRRDNGGRSPLFELADIIKIEFPVMPVETQERLIRRYKGKKTFIAEKVETPDDYKEAIRIGYSFFQGYFFSKPIMESGVDIGSLNTDLLYIIQELRRKEPDYDSIAEIIAKDLGLSYKLLKMSNSIHYGTIYPIKSLKQALARLGTERIRQWVYLMLLQDVQRHENAELVKACVIRGRMLSLLAEELGEPAKESDYFITGIFSSLDAILNNSMENIVNGLPLEEDVKNALLGEENEMRTALDSVLAFEKGRWGQIDRYIREKNLSEGKYMELYYDALKWHGSLPA